MTVFPKRQPGLAFLGPKSKDVSNILIFLSLHIVNFAGRRKAIHLTNTLIKVVNMHIITGQFSPTVIHHALWNRNCTLQAPYRISKFHTSLSSRNGEHRISNGKNRRGGEGKWHKSHCLPSCTYQIKANTPCSMV